MVSALSPFGGLSAADISTLFGTAASSDPTANDGAKTSAGANSGTPITGFAAGSNAAKAIQAIVTQIQMEKIQTKSASLSFASVATTYGVRVPVPSATGYVSLDMTAVDRTASASANDTAGAVGALLDQVNGRAAQIASDQGGALVTQDEYILGRGGYSTLLNWTATSATIATKGFSSDGIMTGTEQGMLQGVQLVSSDAQKFQSPASPSDADAISSSADTTGATALYLDISIGDDTDFSKLEAQEQQLVSAFEKGAMPGQNGATPEKGTGFSFDSETGVYGGQYSIEGVQMSDYDPSVVAERVAKNQYVANTVDYFNHRYSGIAQGFTMGGTVVGAQFSQYGQPYRIQIVIPLTHS